jgi:hypothetical protein
MPDQSITTGTGVVGMGSTGANGFTVGRGGVFGSSGSIAQLQLPAPDRELPATGKLGDLYATKEQPPRTNYFLRLERPFLRKKSNILVPPCLMAAYLKLPTIARRRITS